MSDLALVPPPVPPPARRPRRRPLLPPPIPLRLGATGCFTGRMRAFRRIILRGALLQVVTFGIYRFWLTTDARRFLWANTEIGGDSLEYSGTAMELFLGFLMAIALLVPVYVLLFVGSLELGLVSQLSSVGAFAFLAVFGQYAYYRARRYRLTRTVFRGIRFHQSGSALAYALRSLCGAWSPRHARPRLSVGAGEPRALQARAHPLRRLGRQVRRQRNAAVCPRHRPVAAADRRDRRLRRGGQPVHRPGRAYPPHHARPAPRTPRPPSRS